MNIVLKIPEFLCDWPFWVGFGSGIGVCVVFILVVLFKFGVDFRVF